MKADINPGGVSFVRVYIMLYNLIISTYYLLIEV